MQSESRERWGGGGKGECNLKDKLITEQRLDLGQGERRMVFPASAWSAGLVCLAPLKPAVSCPL